MTVVVKNCQFLSAECNEIGESSSSFSLSLVSLVQNPLAGIFKENSLSLHICITAYTITTLDKCKALWAKPRRVRNAFHGVVVFVSVFKQ